ncbi:hypothetical protein FA15DRAFT_280196 [Coprinopsis marcescibilis]|uniref:Uncharacterized protein n=1 Tax=Coprinopsis marcescibilis TaxID=230819 RepID=A0A5C3KDJ2_COPMA|nr:hypothetical protein FA15DRAFT_280196 [Coprinopsis marcescibilis]
MCSGHPRIWGANLELKRGESSGEWERYEEEQWAWTVVHNDYEIMTPLILANHTRNLLETCSQPEPIDVSLSLASTFLRCASRLLSYCDDGGGGCPCGGMGVMTSLRCPFDWSVVSISISWCVVRDTMRSGTEEEMWGRKLRVLRTPAVRGAQESRESERTRRGSAT